MAQDERVAALRRRAIITPRLTQLATVPLLGRRNINTLLHQSILPGLNDVSFPVWMVILQPILTDTIVVCACARSFVLFHTS